MGSRFGKLFSITTWGEAHGPAIGVVVDGCPAGLALNENDIQQELDTRRPGTSKQVSPRKEPDKAQILSGVFEGETTGTPISIIIWNKDIRSEPYDVIKHLLRPGHANSTYLAKFGIFDHRGGGRASARETATRVAGGAVALKLLKVFGIDIETAIETGDIDEAIKDGDSVGGIVTLKVLNIAPGLGMPVFDRLEADLAKALMSIPASKGFEIGQGFNAAAMRGSEHNDGFDGQTNHAGGTLGGISTGSPIECRVAFKPTSTIKKTQKTQTVTGDPAVFDLPPGHRHDPCVALRAAPVCKAMAALVLADHLLANQLSQLKTLASTP